MAWEKKYDIRFQSLRQHTQYVAYILVQSDSPLAVTQLTGAATPFETAESKDDDIFAPMRPQTGTLRIIDDTINGELLADLLPENNLEKMVELWSGTWNSQMTVFTPDTLMWRGFICAEAFTQPWDNNKKMIELPIKSALAALEDITLSSEDAGGTTKFSQLFIQAFTKLGFHPDNIYLQYNVSGGPETFYWSNFWNLTIQSCALYQQESSVEEGQDTLSWIGMSYYDVFASYLRLFGLMARERGGDIYLVMYDKPSTSIHCVQYTWTQLNQAAGQTLDALSDLVFTWPDDRDFLTNVEFIDKNNTESFLQGAKRVSVTLPLQDYKISMDLPGTDESGVVNTVTVDNPTVKVQPHNTRLNGIETFKFLEYNGNTLVGPSNYEACLNNSVIISNTSWISQHTITGAFPCRWLHSENSAEPSLKNGLFLNQRYMSAAQSYDNDICYAIKTDLNYSLPAGYLNIKMGCYNFDQGPTGTPSFPQPPTTPHFGKWTGTYPVPAAMQTELYVVIRYGNKYWYNAQNRWETFTTVEDAHATPISFDNNGIKSNHTADIHTTETEGFFIPLDSGMSGAITLYIADIASHREGTSYRYVHSRIIADLKVQYLPDVELLSNTRNENIYRKMVLLNGFQGEKNITLLIGTNNYNRPSPSFLKNYALDEPIETWGFFIDANRTTENRRPETVLLNRVAAQYSTIRHNYVGSIKSQGLNLMSSAFTYAGKRFFAIDEQHDWRNDVQRVKLIEVT